MHQTFSKANTSCFHCGEKCRQDAVHFDDKLFCCDGCRMVYDLLKENNLCNYYTISDKAGISPKWRDFQGRFEFLDDPATAAKLIRYQDKEQTVVVFKLPQIHCSSCVWLLENLYKLNPAVLSSRTNFLQKEITIQFQTGEITIRKLVELLTSLGYEPLLNYASTEEQTDARPLRKRVYRIVVAGFCFANIMMLSFPEYFHISEQGDGELQRAFTYLILFLSFPVLIYSGGEFFVSAWRSIRAKFLSIDVPLALSIAITFVRSLYEIISSTGSGYLDSMSGIIFFMLIGRFFQERTQNNLKFDRNYKSFFPISVMVEDGKGNTRNIPLANLQLDDVLIVHSQELVPADCILTSERAHIDYSFVTGEANPVVIRCGEIIYAGGKQISGAIECRVLREVSQSYLTDLWNNEAFQKTESKGKTYIDGLAKYFSLFLILLSVGSFLYWMPTDISKGLNALTTVLIVACPCALLLSSTFTNGAVMRIFGKNKCYLKNPGVIEELAKVDELVFDKTGTVTNNTKDVRFYGEELDEEILTLIYSVARHSNHPLSKALTWHLRFCEVEKTTAYDEIPGMGVRAEVSGITVEMGNALFCKVANSSLDTHQGAKVFVNVDGEYLGYFGFNSAYRKDTPHVFKDLLKRYRISFLSGDNEYDRPMLTELVGKNADIRFHQSPANKLDYVFKKQAQLKRVAMIGDGLNDAGALQQSNVGIAITDDVNNFSPACDAILEGASFSGFEKLLHLARIAQYIIIASFGISLLYNMVGLSYAVRGDLSPVIAAILMPLSSITIILFTNGLSYLSARVLGLK